MLAAYQARFAFVAPEIKEKARSDLSAIVVIPVYDEPQLKRSLASLLAAFDSTMAIEVILVFNCSERESLAFKQKEQERYKESLAWARQYGSDRFRVYTLIHQNLPHKHAGVGLARKIGMDEAAARLFSVDQPEAPIICFDADSQCASNYLTAVVDHFQKDKNTSACSIHFEHPLAGEEFPASVYEGIAQYELHLRYYRQALQYAKAPFAFHTIGSSMAVKGKDYIAQGGMNRRKAGEDFYFLQKFIELGNFSELNATTVIPSPRPSHRVPFGTGRAIKEWMEGERAIDETYHFRIFEALKRFFTNVDHWRNGEDLPANEIIEFLGGEEKWRTKLAEIKLQSTDATAFRKRFFRWFNAFQTLKYVHFMRDRHFPNVKLTQATQDLLARKNVQQPTKLLMDQLEIFREMDRRTLVL